eukprot:12638370-Alexandrium_andersonii.AAC.1
MCGRPPIYLEQPRPDDPIYAAPGEPQFGNLTSEQKEIARGQIASAAHTSAMAPPPPVEMPVGRVVSAPTLATGEAAPI